MADAKPDPKEALQELMDAGERLRSAAQSLMIGSVEAAGSNASRLSMACNHWSGVQATHSLKLWAALEEKR